MKENIFRKNDVTCFHGSVGTPNSSMLGLAQLAKALPRLGTIIKRELARNARVADIMKSEISRIVKFKDWFSFNFGLNKFKRQNTL